MDSRIALILLKYFKHDHETALRDSSELNVSHAFSRSSLFTGPSMVLEIGGGGGGGGGGRGYLKVVEDFGETRSDKPKFYASLDGSRGILKIYTF